MKIRNIKILFIEDNPVKQKKFNKIGYSFVDEYEITVSNRDNFSELFLDTSFPDIILLDLKSEEKNDLKFLRKIKKDANLKHIPIIILTKSKNKKEIKEFYNIGISGCILKPIKEEDYIEKIETILQYWDINEFKK